MPYTELQQRIEALLQETNCSRELAQQAVIANYPKPGRTEMPVGQRVLCRARSLMANKGYGWSRAIDVAAETVE